jgi:hypothetical protein
VDDHTKDKDNEAAQKMMDMQILYCSMAPAAFFKLEKRYAFLCIPHIIGKKKKNAFSG